MPIYEYQCNHCDHRMETIHKVSQPPLQDCPLCGRPALRKLVSAAAFKLTGTGWYATDFKRNATQESDKQENKPAAKDAAKSDDKTATQADAAGKTQQKNKESTAT